jgi:HEXXH motif-containing protein
VCEVLAHESAHSLLFGFTVDEALQDNPDEELYASPLRVDPRPMDGIYHATFVSARMHWAMTRLAESGLLTEEQREKAYAAAASDLTNFDAGYGVVAAHGVLTDTGAALMRGAHDYMQSVR